MTRSANLTVNPPAPVALSSLALSPSAVGGGLNSTATLTLTAPAPAGGLSINLSSSKPNKAGVPPSVTVPAGASSASFNVMTLVVRRKTQVTISASYNGVTKRATLTIVRK